MTYILDTHILLWLRFSPEMLSEIQRQAIEAADEEKFVSSITAWEISLKFSLGKLDLGGHTPEQFIAGIYALGIKIIAPTPEQYATYYQLPKIDGHKDPFDRMIIWHAIQNGAKLVSSDRKISDYKLHGLAVV